MEKPIIYVGLDVHKDTIAVALAEAGPRKEVRDHGTIANTPAALKKLIAKLASRGHELWFCYEAGPVRLWYPTADRSGGSRMLGGSAIVDSQKARRPG